MITHTILIIKSFHTTTKREETIMYTRTISNTNTPHILKTIMNTRTISNTNTPHILKTIIFQNLQMITHTILIIKRLDTTTKREETIMNTNIGQILKTNFKIPTNKDAETDTHTNTCQSTKIQKFHLSST